MIFGLTFIIFILLIAVLSMASSLIVISIKKPCYICGIKTNENKMLIGKEIVNICEGCINFARKLNAENKIKLLKEIL